MRELSTNWQLTQTEAGQFTFPSELEDISRWIPAKVPGTVAQSLEQHGAWSIEQRIDFDDFDFWYKCSFEHAKLTTPVFLNFAGLATIAEVWLNNKKILDCNNMYVSHYIDVTKLISESNELDICFRSLNNALRQRRPRPRWKTKVVEQQQLRWFRTTLLGRIPGWTPPVAPVGPWQAITLHERPHLQNPMLSTTLKGDVGTVSFNGELIGSTSDDIKVFLNVDGTEVQLTQTKTSDDHISINGQLTIDNPGLWWPHTHGEPNLYTASLVIKSENIAEEVLLSPVGFKVVELDTHDNNFHFRINGATVFCRGACWTINDIVSLIGEPETLRQTLTLMRDAGANMIRIGGTMIYEQDLFYRLCDELGIMVWQDLMFANMDYPFDDDDFLVNVDIEIQQQLSRLAAHTCMTAYCGNSEIEQQVAMLGMPKELWAASYFTKQLPGLCHQYHPGIPYITSSPTGEVLPFHTNKGLTHYYGIGAYLNSISELRSHDVRFTSESLGFANIPVARTRNSVLAGQLPVTHHPKWKERTPRDTGPGWDFEDVRDHYLAELYKVDPVKLRSFEPERYMELSEVVSGEMMLQVYSEWRSQHSQCQGGLIWFLKDFWPGAGWGIVDSNNLPKACYYYLKRSWKPIQLCLVGETLNGVHAHIVNESGKAFTGRLTFTLVDQVNSVVAEQSVDVLVEPGAKVVYESDQVLDGFYDVAYTYRFGPPKHMAVIASLENINSEHIDVAYYFPDHGQAVSILEASIDAQLVCQDEDNYLLKLSSEQFLYSVNIDVKGFQASDNYFHISARNEKNVLLTRIDKGISKCKGYVSALNTHAEVKIS